MVSMNLFIHEGKVSVFRSLSYLEAAITHVACKPSAEDKTKMQSGRDIRGLAATIRSNKHTWKLNIRKQSPVFLELLVNVFPLFQDRMTKKYALQNVILDCTPI